MSGLSRKKSHIKETFQKASPQKMNMPLPLCLQAVTVSRKFLTVSRKLFVWFQVFMTINIRLLFWNHNTLVRTI